MLYRKCSAGHDIRFYRYPYGMKEASEIGKIPSDRFCLVAHKKVLYDGDSFPLAEQTLVDACAKHHGKEEEQHGRQRIGMHHMIDHMLVTHGKSR